MSTDEMNVALSRARELMSENYMQKMNKIAKLNNPVGTGVGSGISNEQSIFEQALGYSSSSSGAVQTREQKQQKRSLASQALMESFTQTPPLSGDSFPAPQNYHPSVEMITEQQRPQQGYVPQAQVVQAPAYIPQSGAIDYSIIKMLINEAIKENLDTLKKSLISENTLHAVRMPGGNKIQFLDKAGNVYEGNLVCTKRKQQAQ